MPDASAIFDPLDIEFIVDDQDDNSVTLRIFWNNHWTDPDAKRGAIAEAFVVVITKETDGSYSYSVIPKVGPGIVNRGPLNLLEREALLPVATRLLQGAVWAVNVLAHEHRYREPEFTKRNFAADRDRYSLSEPVRQSARLKAFFPPKPKPDDTTPPEPWEPYDYRAFSDEPGPRGERELRARERHEREIRERESRQAVEAKAKAESDAERAKQEAIEKAKQLAANAAKKEAVKRAIIVVATGAGIAVSEGAKKVIGGAIGVIWPSDLADPGVPVGPPQPPTHNK